MASVVLLALGIWKLALQRRWFRILKWVLLLSLWPIAAALAFRIEDGRLRLWTAIPIAALLPVWLLSGFFVSKEADEADQPKVLEGGSTRRRLWGTVLLAFGLTCWTYGAFTPNMPKGVEVAVLVGFMYSSLYGVMWVLTGKSF